MKCTFVHQHVLAAYDILIDSKKRRAYDSVDPTFDDVVPSICTASKENYYYIFGPVFRENSRWSTEQPVVQLGSEDTPISEVDAFFSFWYDILCKLRVCGGGGECCSTQVLVQHLFQTGCTSRQSISQLKLAFPAEYVAMVSDNFSFQNTLRVP